MGRRGLLPLALAWAVVAAGCAAPPIEPATGATSPRPLVLLVGDSTMAPDTGYGDALCARLEPAADCLNLGRGGRSTLSYRAEGLWERVLARVRAAEPGTPVTVLVQFGHNDQPGKPGRSTDLAGEFPANLTRYVADLRAAGAAPVLLTPLARRSFGDGRLVNDLEPWAQAVRGVARQLGVALVDLNASSAARVQALGPEEADRLAQGPAGDPRFDRTHLGPRGACVFAALVLDGLHSAAPALARRTKAGEDCAQVPPPGPDTRRSVLDGATWRHAGWAVGTMGGQGGRIERVTTLAAAGPGSLRAALEAPGARAIVFEVGGVIDLGGESLRIRHPFVTIAGQTAPSPGITLIKGGLDIGGHDVILQHIAIRPGAYGRARRSGPDHDGLSTIAAHHVIVDHCSFSWASDENLSASGPRFGGGSDPEAWRRATSHAITYSHNLVFEGLSDSVHPKGEHSKGTLIHDNASGVLLLGNLWVSNRERNPLFKGGARGAVVNNLVFNPGRRAIHYNLWRGEWQGHAVQTGRLAVLGNVLRHGPDTLPATPLFGLGGDGPLELLLQDNLAWRADGTPASLVDRYRDSAAAQLLPMPPGASALPPRLPVLPAAELEATLPAMVGARPWDRNAIDRRVLAELAAGRGRLIDDESEVGGHPPVREATRRAFDPAAWDLRTMTPRAGWPSLR
jgi:lysophospholipase L1-like esterase